MTSQRCSLAVTALLIVGCALVSSRAGAQSPPGFAKVHPAVWAFTANGREAELIVVMSEQADLSFAATIDDRDDRRRFVHLALYSTAERTQPDIRAFLAARRAELRSFYIVNALWTRGDRQLVLELAAREDVARVEANPSVQVVKPMFGGGVPPVGTRSIEWNVDRTMAPAAWPEGSGQGIVVGGQDTGVRFTHQALLPQYRGWDGALAIHDYNWHDAIHAAAAGNPCGSDSPVPCDDGTHGTHTMGTAVGDDGLGNQVGMAPAAKWIACRNMDQGWGTPATYIECFEFFLAPYPVGATPAAGDPALGPDVTVNSWACPPAEGCAWDTLQAAVDAQRAAGIMTVVAAGNSGPACGSVTDPPGVSDSAYTIGATDSADNLAGFSSRGPATGSGVIKPDIVAPGVGVRSCTATADDTYDAFSGTSMATPHVAGAVAVLWSARPTYRGEIAQTESLLDRTARRLPVAEGCGGDDVLGPNNSWGHGLIDLGRAVIEACVSPEVACTDAFDGDCDGLLDCADPDCDGDLACPEALACADGRDNDLDRRIDCADRDCAGDGACPEVGNCADGVDNDLDTLTDCVDPDCDGDASCPEALACSDGRDNDLDGRPDCADDECAGDSACPEVGNCGDGVDNDADTLVDCADPECLGEAACGLEDWDGDGRANAEDCRPLDSSTFAVPPEGPRLDARNEWGAAVLTWDDMSALAGTGSRYEIASETIESLQAGGGARGACVGAVPGWRDERDPAGLGYFYLVRAIGRCGPGTGIGWGADSSGVLRAGCP